MQALKFITCGSVDDGKSTLIGRLLVDSRAVLQDQLAGITRDHAHGQEIDFARLTDGLSAEREQGITIDVAYRYFSTPARKFIIGDTPGHEQYTRNMVTAASSADAAVVLVDATKLDWRDSAPALLPQTRRHTLLAHLLRVPAIVFAVNKLDAVEDPALAHAHISAALRGFAAQAGVVVAGVIPVSALKGHNVVDRQHGWAGYDGPSLLELLEQLPATPAEVDLPYAQPVQWVETFSGSADTSQGRRVFWGRVGTGAVQPGLEVTVMPSGRSARVAQVLDHARRPATVRAGHGAGVVLDRELDISRGDWLLALDSFQPSRQLQVTVAWLDDDALVAGRVYWVLHGHRWVKARVQQIAHRLDIGSLQRTEATELRANEIGDITLALQEPLATLPYSRSRSLGSLILVDTASHKTSGAALVI